MSELVPYRSGGYVPPPRDFGNVSPGYPEGYPEPHPDTPGIREYLAIVRRQLWLVLAVVILVVGPTVYSVMQTPPRYRAVSTIRLADDSRRTLAGDVSPYDVVGRETDILQSQIQILGSQAVGAEAVDLEGLRLRPAPRAQFVDEMTNIRVADNATADSVAVSFGPTSIVATTARTRATTPYGQPLQIEGVTFTVMKQPSIATTAFNVVSREDAISEVLGGFSANPRPKTDIIDLSYVGVEPHQAKRLTNAMAVAFQAHNAASSQLQSKRRRIFLESQLKQTDSMLMVASYAYSNYRSRAQVFSSKEKASAQEQGLVDIDMRRADLDAERRTYETLLAQARQSGESNDASLRLLVSSPGIAANPVIQQLYAQLTMYEGIRDSLSTAGAAASNPDIVAVNSRISATADRLMSAVRSQIQALTARIQSIDNLRAKSSSQIAAAPATETEEGQLGEQVKTVQKMSEDLQAELQKAKMAEAVEAGQVEIVDLAKAPGGQIPSGAPRKVALGVIIALLIGIGLAVVVDGMNTSIRRRTDIERLLQVPGLAVIPRLVRSTPIDRGLQRALPRRTGNGGKPPKKKGIEELVTVTDMRSASAEAYRTLRTNLIFSQSVQTLRTVLVTSASPGEGKTTTAANLAVSFAHHGMRVLLVDCDLRRGRLHKIFQISREPGITELVLGREEVEGVIRQTDVTGLYVIPSGNLPPNPSELLGGDRMRKVLASLSEGFDLIIIDTPPLLAASDGAILATLSDGVVMVLRAGSTEGEAAQQALQQLTGVGARVVGAVLNDPDAKVPTYSGYYHYEYASAVD